MNSGDLNLQTNGISQKEEIKRLSYMSFTLPPKDRTMNPHFGSVSLKSKTELYHLLQSVF